MANEKVRVPVKMANVRLSYPSLFTKKAYEEGNTKKYEATFIIPKSDKKTVAAIMSAYKEACVGNFGKDIPLNTTSEKALLRDGDVLKPDDPNYENSYFMVAKNEKTILLLDGKKQVVEGEEVSPFYAGCYVNVKMTFYPVDRGKTKGIFASLDGLMFAGNGEPFESSNRAEVSDFDDFDDSEDDGLGF